jgi:hypothetical protein
MAINNAHKYFNINSLEEEIIKTHMFPLTKETYHHLKKPDVLV